MTNPTHFIQANHLTKHYYKRSLWYRQKIIETKAMNDVSFSLKSNKITGLIGESGSGKTTLALSLAGLLPLTSGSLIFEQRPLNLYSKHDCRFLSTQVRMVFQHPKASLNPRKTIFDSLGHSLLYHRQATKKNVHDKVAASLELVGLSSDYFYQYPHQLSGGQQQRVSIARALLGSPKLIICDEVVSALDVSMQAQILNMLSSIQTTFQHTYLFISHDLAVVRSFCSDLLIMYQGKIVESGNTEQIFTNPQHPYTRSLLASQLPDTPKERTPRKPTSNN